MRKHIDLLIERYPILCSIQDDIYKAFDIMKTCYENGGKLLIAGNGGSAADSEHIVGELMKGFVKKRKINAEFATALQNVDAEMGAKLSDMLQMGLPAIALTGHNALTTAYVNDMEPLFSFAQQLNGYGKQDDVFLGISTSGNSENVYAAAVVAKAKGMKVIGLAGGDGGRLAKISDVAIVAPIRETYQIQELHLPIYHTLCLMLEEYFYKE